MREGRLQEAIELLREAAISQPGAVEVHNNLGNALALSGQFDAAISCYRNAIALHEEFAEAHNNLANALMARSRIDQAIVHYGKAVALKPGYVEAELNLANARNARARSQPVLAAPRPRTPETHLRLGNELMRLGNVSEAIARYEQAVALRPDLAEAWLRLGDALFRAERYLEALSAYGGVDTLSEAWLGRARVFKHLNRSQEAISAYREALARGAEPQSIHYFLASFGVEPPPVMAPKELIRSTYDQHAGQYEQHMLGQLKYRIPDLLHEELIGHLPSNAIDVLDLGCGTGLVGAKFRDVARSMTGVDLSPAMIEIARQWRIYDQLICAEIQEFLQGQRRTFDLIAAADVLVYFGDLSQVFDGISRALGAGGVLAFSVEAGEERDFDLKPTLRFTHSRNYVERLARDYGFAVEAINARVLRQEDKNDVAGYIAVLRRA